MSENADTGGRDRCHYPGCTRPRRPDPATGRPSRYCEEADAGGGPVHNRATAWKARRAGHGGVTTQDDPGIAAPVSLARATLDQRLADLPTKIADLRQYLDELAVTIRAAGDIEAAGAEVEDAHRDALTKITEAERRAAAAERAGRLADERAERATRDREEADLLADEAATEAAAIREQTQTEIAAIRAEADALVARAQQQVADRDADLENAHRAVAAAQAQAAAAQAAQRAADDAADRERDTATQLRRELDQTRRDFDDAARAEREALRSAHAEQLAQLQRNANDRVDALTEALAVAKDAAEMYRSQLPTPGSPAPTRAAPRKRT
jgi:chromosome segregation ATPase